MKRLSWKTHIGNITIMENDGVLVSVKLDDSKYKDETPLLLKVKDKINKYLSGKKVKWDFKSFNEGSETQKNIWNAIAEIPYGETRSYLEIAIAANSSPRYVGRVCGQNNLLIIVPCHRVISSSGKMGGYSAPEGLDTKKALLGLESRNI